MFTTIEDDSERSLLGHGTTYNHTNVQTKDKWYPWLVFQGKSKNRSFQATIQKLIAYFS